MSVHLDSRSYVSVTKDSDLFKKISQTTGKTIYSLRVEKLSEDNCYIFFCDNNLRNRLVIKMLEYNTFHPKSKISEKFQIDQFIYDDSIVSMVYFPREFKEVCKRAAKTFDMTIVTGKVTVKDTLAATTAEDFKKRIIFERVTKPVFIKKQFIETTYVFPKADNILWAEGKPITKQILYRHQKDIRFWGDYFQKAGVD